LKLLLLLSPHCCREEHGELVEAEKWGFRERTWAGMWTHHLPALLSLIVFNAVGGDM